MDALAEALGLDLADPTERALLDMHEQRYRVMDDLVRARLARGMSQEDVATALGVSRVAVSRMERENRDPRLSTLTRYASAVGYSIKISAEPIATWGYAQAGSMGVPEPHRALALGVNGVESLSASTYIKAA